MTDVEFAAPLSLDEAWRLLAMPNAGTRLLAGGTDLIVQMRSGRTSPQRIVDIKQIPELVGVRSDRGGFLIGAATPCAIIGEHSGLLASWPGVVEASRLIGSTQVQGRASLGGNLCNASPAADSVPALIAAGASCVIGSASAQRELAVEAFLLAPGKTALAAGELLLALRLPARAARSGDAYLRLIPRTEMDIAVVGAGVSVTVDAARKIVSARVAIGAVAPTALLVTRAAHAIVGSTLSEAVLTNLEAAVRAVCRPIDDKRGTIAYRTQVAGVLARRAALIAYDRAQS